MKPKFLTTVATGLTCAALSCSAAELRLWPTTVGLGDCVATIIRAPKSTFAQELEERECVEGYQGDRTGAKNCIRDRRRDKAVAFFTDRCGDGQEYFISLNGVEYTLTKITGKHPQDSLYVGSYEGQGLTVTVSNPKKTKTRYEKDEQGQRYSIGALYSVTVVIVRGHQREEFVGEIVTGP